MLMLGVLNVPVSDPGFADEMSMKMVGVGQSIPYRGKLALRRRIASLELSATEATLLGVERAIVRDLRSAYYELAFLDRALEIAERNRNVLMSLIEVSEARYGSGVAGQQDVLKARVEAGRLAETAVSLTERRLATLARLNAVLDRPSDSPVSNPSVPRRIARAAVADSMRDVRFVSAALGARAAGSPLPPVEALQALALRESPALREATSLSAIEAARAELAGLAARPDIDVSLQYGQRSGYPDMVSATVSVPFPLQRRQKQQVQAAEARAVLSASQAEWRAQRSETLADVARLHAELERVRSQLALYVKSIIPQGRASLTSATTSYQAGRVEFMTVLENQATLFNYEMEYFRLVSEFATMLAELEQVVGKDVLP
jgi:outer membrane protein TolC